MKRNGTEYVEIGAGGHPRLRVGKSGGYLDVIQKCNAFFARRGLPRSEAGFVYSAKYKGRGRKSAAQKAEEAGDE